MKTYRIWASCVLALIAVAAVACATASPSPSVQVADDKTEKVQWVDWSGHAAHTYDFVVGVSVTTYSVPVSAVTVSAEIGGTRYPLEGHGVSLPIVENGFWEWRGSVYLPEAYCSDISRPRINANIITEYSINNSEYSRTISSTINVQRGDPVVVHTGDVLTNLHEMTLTKLTLPNGEAVGVFGISNWHPLIPVEVFTIEVQGANPSLQILSPTSTFHILTFWDSKWCQNNNIDNKKEVQVRCSPGASATIRVPINLDPSVTGPTEYIDVVTHCYP